MLSIAQATARRWLESLNEQERGWVPRRGRASWLGLMHEVAVLRAGWMFSRAHPDLTPSENDTVVTRTNSNGGASIATCGAVTRAGCHYAEFTALSRASLQLFGVVRPDWGATLSDGGVDRPEPWGSPDATGAPGHCFFRTDGGYRFPGWNGSRTHGDWQGKRSVDKLWDCIGMLLDLDAGTMALWLNGERLGVMVTDLSGEYRWTIDLERAGSSASIGSAPMSARPTEEEVAAAATWIAEHRRD